MGKRRTVWVEDGGFEDHFWGQVGVFGGEDEVGAEEASCFIPVLALRVLSALLGPWGRSVPP